MLPENERKLFACLSWTFFHEKTSDEDVRWRYEETGKSLFFCSWLLIEFYNWCVILIPIQLYIPFIMQKISALFCVNNFLYDCNRPSYLAGDRKKFIHAASQQTSNHPCKKIRSWNASKKNPVHQRSESSSSAKRWSLSLIKLSSERDCWTLMQFSNDQHQKAEAEQLRTMDY